MQPNAQLYYHQGYYPQEDSVLNEDQYVSIPRQRTSRHLDRLTSNERSSLMGKLKRDQLYHQSRELRFPNDGYPYTSQDAMGNPDMQNIDPGYGNLGLNYVSLVTAALDRKMNIILQKQITRARAMGQEEELRSMYLEILPEMVRIAKNSYGNFVIQRLVESVDTDLVDLAVLKLQNDISNIATNQYGCRVVQRLILRSSIEARYLILQELQDDIINVMGSLYGGYCMQTLIQTIPSVGLLDLLNTILIPKVYELCTSQHSSHVMQHVMRFFEAPQKVELSKKILDDIITLSKDQHANYVVQNMISHGDHHTKALALKLITPYIVDLSKNKFGSNVIECCVKHATVEQNLDLLNKLLETEKEFTSVLRHKYGNFVVKCMLKFLPIEQRRVLSNALLDYFQTFNEDLEKLNVYETFLYKLVLRK